MEGCDTTAPAECRVLDREQLARFERDGFLFVPGFFDSSRIEEIERWVQELCEQPELPGQHWVYHEHSLRDPDRLIVQRIERFIEVHRGFERLFRIGRLPMAVSEFLEEPATLFKEKINLKLPGGQGFKAHQDAQAGWNVYAPFFVTALIAIDRSTPENGCLELAAGRHGGVLLSAEWEPLDEKIVAGLEFKPYPTEPGDVLFFDSYVPHRSGPNLTETPRRVLYVTYNRSSEGDHRARYFEDKRRSFPPDIERRPGETYVFRV